MSQLGVADFTIFNYATSNARGVSVSPLIFGGRATVRSSRNAWAIIHNIHNTVMQPLGAPNRWIGVFASLHISQMREARAIAEHNGCKKFPNKTNSIARNARSHEHLICMMDLHHIRTEIDQRIADDSRF